MTLLLQFYIARSYWNSDKPSHSSSALLQTFSAINFSWHLQISCKILRYISWLILLALLYIKLSYKILYSMAMASLKAETCSCFYVPCIYWSCSTYVLLYDPNLPRMSPIIHANSHTANRHKTLRTGTNEFISSLFPRNSPEKWAFYAEGSQKIFRIADGCPAALFASPKPHWTYSSLHWMRGSSVVHDKQVWRQE
jgi:hypothetical protein